GGQCRGAEGAFFRDVVSGVVREQRSLDPLVDKVLAQGWPLKRIEAILRAVLRAGAYELGHRSDVPARVVVSEYVDVANAFVDKDETGMVNAGLDQIARQFRAGHALTRRRFIARAQSRLDGAFAGAKAEMALRPAVDVVDVRVGKLPPIAVAGAECKRHFVADAHSVAVQLGLAHDRALETLRRGVEAQRLLDRRVDQR